MMIPRRKYNNDVTAVSSQERILRDGCQIATASCAAQAVGSPPEYVLGSLSTATTLY